MLGTITSTINIKDSLNHTIITAFEGDRIEGNGSSVVTKLWRRGVPKFSGYGYMEWNGFVDIDGVVEPPPVEPPTDIIRTHVIEVYSDGSISIDGSPRN